MSQVRFDTSFWKALVNADCAVPTGYTVAELTPHLLRLLGSPDPFLRDDVAYLVFARWIVRDQHYKVDSLRDLIKQLTMNLHVGLGEQGTESVLLRSFSALVQFVIRAVTGINLRVGSTAFVFCACPQFGVLFGRA
jgi:hypothetical protein